MFENVSPQNIGESIQLYSSLFLTDEFRTEFRFGTNADVDTGGSEDVWDAGGVYPFGSLATPQALEIVSDSANDTSAGTGARTVKIFGLDGNFEEQSEVVTMNGLTPVDLSLSYLRVLGIQVETAGSAFNSNVGTITLRLDGAGVTVASIRPVYGQSLMAIYTVPKGFDAIFTNARVTIGKNKDADCKLYTREYGQAWYVQSEVQVYQNEANLLAVQGLRVPQKTDIKIQCSTTVVNTDVSAAFVVCLIPRIGG